MPHTARVKSESTVYHVVVKGSGSQLIFEDSSDRIRFLDQLRETVEAFHVQVHAYCLMSNHVHLLLKDVDDELSAFMKRLNERYAMYFSWKAGRVGNVFQTPYWSEPVKTDEHFLATLRYIHANPEPAMICALADYPWSSYRAYLGGASFVTTDLALDLLGNVENFKAFSAIGGRFAKPFPRSQLQNHLSGDELWNVACNIVERKILISLRSMKPKERQPYLEKLAAAGMSEREICRLSGLGKGTVHRALNAA